MQVNRYIALPKTNAFSRKLFLVLRVALAVAILVYLGQAAVKNAGLIRDIGALRPDWSLTNAIYLSTAILLLPLNWLVEGKKWQLLAQSAISFSKAMEGVLLGITLDNLLPLGTGGISGRLMSLRKKYRTMMLPGILAGQVIQSVVTLLFGLIGFYFVVSKTEQILFRHKIYNWVALGLIAVTAIALIFWKKQVIRFLSPLKSYPLALWLRVLVLSVIRYLIFLIQFFVLGLFFAHDIPALLILSCATWVFAARTFMPKVTNLERLGIRALAVLLFADVAAVAPAGLLVTVAVLWFINLAIPSIAGMWYLPQLKREDLF